jgi:hypothetical protein
LTSRAKLTLTQRFDFSGADRLTSASALMTSLIAVGMPISSFFSNHLSAPIVGCGQ